MPDAIPSLTQMAGQDNQTNIKPMTGGLSPKEPTASTAPAPTYPNAELAAPDPQAGNLSAIGGSAAPTGAQTMTAAPDAKQSLSLGGNTDPNLPNGGQMDGLGEWAAANGVPLGDALKQLGFMSAQSDFGFLSAGGGAQSAYEVPEGFGIQSPYNYHDGSFQIADNSTAYAQMGYIQQPDGSWVNPNGQTTVLPGGTSGSSTAQPVNGNLVLGNENPYGGTPTGGTTTGGGDPLGGKTPEEFINNNPEAFWEAVTTHMLSGNATPQEKAAYFSNLDNPDFNGKQHAALIEVFQQMYPGKLPRNEPWKYEEGGELAGNYEGTVGGRQGEYDVSRTLTPEGGLSPDNSNQLGVSGNHGADGSVGEWRLTATEDSLYQEVTSGRAPYNNLNETNQKRYLEILDAGIASGQVDWFKIQDPEVRDAYKRKFGDPAQGYRGATDNTKNGDGGVQGQWEGEQGGAFQGQAYTAAAQGPMDVAHTQASQAGAQDNMNVQNMTAGNMQQMGDRDVATSQSGVAAQNQRQMTDAEMSSNQMRDILSQDGALMQLARQDGVEQANKMGLRNSSLSAGAQMAEMARQATPLAMQQAQAHGQMQAQNQQLESSRLEQNAGRDQQTNMFNADNQNQASNQEFATEAERRKFNEGMKHDESQTNAAAQNQATSQEYQTEAQRNQFNAGMEQEANTFNAGAENQATSQEFGAESQRNQFNAGAQTEASMQNASMANNLQDSDRQRDYGYNLQQLVGDQGHAKQTVASKAASDIANIEGQYKMLISENDTAARMFDATYRSIAEVISNDKIHGDEAAEKSNYLVGMMQNMLDSLLAFENLDLGQAGAEGTGGKSDFTSQTDPEVNNEAEMPPAMQQWIKDNAEANAFGNIEE